MKKSFSLLLIIGFIGVQAAPNSLLYDHIYELTSADERKLRAKILAFNAETISVEAESTKAKYEIPYKRLNQLTQTQLNQLWAIEVNKKLGFDMMPKGQEKLWSHSILNFTKKFNIERKINILNSADYYYMTDYKDQIFGARAYHLRVYPNDLGDKTKLKHIEIEFANVKVYPLSKGQSTIFGESQDSKKLDAAMNADKNKIKNNLNALFGTGFENTTSTHAFTRWDSKGYSFLLELRHLESLLLHIVPTYSLPNLENTDENK